MLTTSKHQIVSPDSFLNTIDSAELEAMMTGWWLTDFSNFSAYCYQKMTEINWAGFYLSDGSKLRLGPFVGLPACTEIEFTRGVCGAAFRSHSITRVADVHQFPGHIACDERSRSEIVIPLIVNGNVIGVFDVDSPHINRFSDLDGELIERALEILVKHNSKNLTDLPWSSINK